MALCILPTRLELHSPSRNLLVRIMNEETWFYFIFSFYFGWISSCSGVTPRGCNVHRAAMDCHIVVQIVKTHWCFANRALN